MVFQVGFRQPFNAGMRVTFRGGNIGVPEDRLHCPNVRAGFQEMCSAAMAQRMGTDAAPDWQETFLD